MPISLLVNLEDLWLEPLATKCPRHLGGTAQLETQSAASRLEQIRKMDSVTEILKTIDQIRKHATYDPTVFNDCKPDSLLAVLRAVLRSFLVFDLH